MKKMFTVLFLVSAFFAQTAIGQGSESFDNLNASGSSYGSGSYTGDNGDTWTYNGARRVTSTYNITGTSIGFGSSGTRNVSSNSGMNGVGNVTFSIRSYFTGGNASNRTMEVFVAGVSRGSFTLAAMGVVETHTIMNIDEPGNIVIQFVSTGSRQIILDDISWTEAPGPLPVALAVFTANLEDDAVALSWTTASEENNDYFSIEHSTDGIDYTEIDYVKGAGTSFLENNYEYFHRNPAKGANYYRLAQVDYNRSINYSSVEVVEIAGGDLFTLYPTLAKGEVTLNFSEEIAQDATIEVFDFIGRRVIATPLEDQVNNQNLDVSQLQNGHYLVRLQAAGEVHTVRFVKY